MLPTFEYDTVKSLNNHTKHGVDFEEAKEVWRDAYMLVVSAKLVGGESREMAIGMIGKKLWSVVYLPVREGHLRIISAREADHRSKAEYLKKKGGVA